MFDRFPNTPFQSIERIVLHECVLKERLKSEKQSPATQKCDALCNLVPFVQFKKREKHPWRKINTPAWVFFTFFKLHK